MDFLTVIPAKAGIHDKKTGFRVKPGMTINIKEFTTQYARLGTVFLSLILVIPAS
jgi:hypothetical protein